jgi:uracil-DNA glycosylase
MLNVHPEWQETINAAYNAIDSDYRSFIENGDFIPARSKIFNAFKTLPKSKVKYILFGQDPYPRERSAIGHAFIDGAVERIFSDKGLSKEVNRATSLRNFIKMALVADGLLTPKDLSQEAIAKIDKSTLIDSIDELRCNFEKSGVLLLNAALLFENKKASNSHVKAWRPFMQVLLESLDENVELILFGNLAKMIKKIPESQKFLHHEMEHPYNHTFILNQKALNLFAPMKLLQKK